MAVNVWENHFFGCYMADFLWTVSWKAFDRPDFGNFVFMSDNQKQFLILYWWIHEEIMEWKCVCAALVNAFTNLWRWFYLWRHSEQSINNRFNESVTNRAEYLFIFKNPSDNWKINMACKTPNVIFFCFCDCLSWTFCMFSNVTKLTYWWFRFR